MFGSPRISYDHLPDEPGVYRVLNVATNECYVGGTGSLRKRGGQHSTMLTLGTHYNKSLQRSFREHGAENFRIEVLDLCEIRDVCHRERKWIEDLKPTFNTHAGDSNQRKYINMSKPAPRTAKKSPRSYAVGIRRQKKIERRGRVLSSLLCGEVPAVIAQREGISVSYVYTIANKGGVSAVDARRERAREVLDQVREGKSVFEVTLETGIPYHTLRDEALKAGIQLTRGQRQGSINDKLAVVTRQQWESADWTLRDAELGRQLGVSRERVRQVRILLKKPKPVDGRRRAVSA